MWIRNTLIVLPLVLLSFLLGSWAWVPSTAEISADPTRQDRMILNITGDPNSMNPWFSSTSTDSDVHSWIFEGLASADGNLVPEPCLAEKLKVGEDVVLYFSPGDDVDGICVVIDEMLSRDFPATYRGIVEYVHRDFEGGAHKFINSKDGKKRSKAEREGSDPKAEAAASSGLPQFTRRVVQLRATEPKSKKDIPSAVITDIVDRIDAALRTKGRDNDWSKSYSRWAEACQMYVSAMELQDSLGTPEVAAELAKDATAEQKKVQSEGRKKHADALTAAAKAARGERARSFDEWLAAYPEQRVSEHPVIDVTLREGVKWHDYATSREVFDIDDVVFTYSFALDRDVITRGRVYVDSMVQLRVTSNMTCEILYGELYSPALFHLTYAKILPEHKFTEEEWIRQAKLKGRGPAFDGDKAYNMRKALPPQELDFTLAPIGTGPMKMYPLNGASLPMWRSGERVTLERNDDYWDKENVAAYKYFDLYIIDASLGQETAEVNFLSGGMDVFGIRPHQVAKYEAMRDRYYVYKRPNLQYEYLAFNLEREPFKDFKVRRALAIAVDVDAMMQAITYGQSRRVSGPSYPMLPYYNHEYFPNHTMLTGPNAGKSLKELGEKYLPYDLVEAEAVLKEAGWARNSAGALMKDGKQMSFELMYSGTASEPRGKVSALAAEKWRQLGIDVKLREMDFNVFVNERVKARNFDAIALGWNGGIDFDKRVLWASDQLPPEGLNFTSYNDPESDKFFTQMLREYDTAKILSMSHEAFQRIADAQPYIFLFSSYSNLAVDRHLYWAKARIGPDGKVILGPDGLPEREAHSFVADGQMDWMYGPRTNRMQHRRGATIQFPAHDNERAVVGEPITVKDLAASSRAAVDPKEPDK